MFSSRTALVAAIFATAFTLSSPAMSQIAYATTTTSVALLTGPAPTYPALTIIPAYGVVSVLGCPVGSVFCEVIWGGYRGWTYGASLAMTPTAGPVIPPGQMPPAGQCRYWYPGVPPGQQPPPFPC